MTDFGFEFVSKLNPTPLPGETVVVVPRGITRKDQLFAVYARALKFPDYFGGNWDAFEECLRDLAWLPQPVSLRIVHEGHPFRIDSPELKTYAQILASLTEPSPGLQRNVRVQFHRRHLRALETLL